MTRSDENPPLIATRQRPVLVVFPPENRLKIDGMESLVGSRLLLGGRLSRYSAAAAVGCVSSKPR